MKSLYEKLGIYDKSVVFLFTDGHVAEESFLELINNMLTSGALAASLFVPLIMLSLVHPVSSAALLSYTFQYYLK